MKTLILSGFVSTTIFILLNISVYQVTDGQKVTLARQYKRIVFDKINRGSFNVSQCLSDLLNCWEVVRGDVLCAYDKYKESICGFFKDNCHDFYGKLDSNWGLEYTLYESYCQDSSQSWTK
ncbi:uncharacterized protein LOC124643615 [Helicoverpa zea]|uniref:Transmembrane protein n=1 Tax=Helicoverpa armigera TaxID=29058 RepID=A0A2W1BUS6_HELAM|nr:uncharacterized protein LOC110377743 [Helicoverpa armigera]XP_047038585.1 uncharacterized protein LOC124643615 [Helicoverpa zea]PZC76406.1 hypothetical protein B5X24_HaOG204705 [Helicoverpa armigera]